MYSAVFFTEILFAILVLAIIAIVALVIIWAVVSAYKKRGEEIRSLREKLEKLKSEGG